MDKIVNTKFPIWLLATVLLTTASIAEAQQPKKVPRIGYLSPLSRVAEASRMEGFHQGLRDLGYVEGQNLIIEYRFPEGKLDRLPELAADLVSLKVDVIVTGGSSPTRAAQRETKTIPIVMAYMSDPVALGFVASLARPGGNITGLSQLAPQLGGKRLELLKEVVPQISRVAVLGDPQAEAYGSQLQEMKVAARALGVQLQPVELQRPNDLEKAFSAITRERADAVIGLTGPAVSFLRKPIVELAAKNRLPAIYPFVEFVDAGGLMSYAPNYADLFRRAATFVDKILKGAKPADLPVEQPTKFELIINLKTAKQIGLTIPPNVLARADKVIR